MVEQQQSGQSVAAFCRERCLRDGLFYDWKKLLRQAVAEPFVAVELVASQTIEAAISSAATPSVPIEIRLCQGRSLLVGPDFEAAHLRRLLQVLEQET